MQIPENLTVGPFYYKIEFADVVDENDRDLCGQVGTWKRLYA